MSRVGLLITWAGSVVVCFGVPESGAVLAERTCTQDVSPRAVLAGVSEDCCLDYHPCVGPSFVRRVAGYRRQEVSGSCNLPAVM